MGVVDEAYILLTKDSQAIIGRKITISSNEVQELTSQLLKIAELF